MFRRSTELKAISASTMITIKTVSFHICAAGYRPDPSQYQPSGASQPPQQPGKSTQTIMQGDSGSLTLYGP